MCNTAAGSDNACDRLPPLSEITSILQSGMYPNAFLFTGNARADQKQAAFFFAKSANCLSRISSPPPCDTCRSCKKINAGMHPDIIEVLCENQKQITVSKIREVGSQITVKPNEAAVRVVMLHDAETMNPPAQNAMLKMLEEPPGHTVFILTAPGIRNLLPTILSRCRKIHFSPLTAKEIQNKLVLDFKVDPMSARTASCLCNGDFEKALFFLDLSEGNEEGACWVNRRAWIFQSLFTLLEKTGTHWPDAMVQGLHLAERLNARPELLPDSLCLVQSFFRDLLVYRYQPEKLINPDFFDSFKDKAAKFPYNTMLTWMKHLFDVQRRIEANTVTRLTLEQFFIKLASEGI